MKLVDGSSQKIFARILDVITRIQDEAEENEFVGDSSRLLSSGISCLIVEDKKEVGFIYLLEERINGIYFLDMALLKEYRNKGVGYSALKEFLDIYNYNNFILAEVKEDNIACLNLLKKLNSIQVSTDYYLLQPERIEEFNRFIVEENIDLTLPNMSARDVVEMFRMLKEDKPKVKVKKR